MLNNTKRQMNEHSSNQQPNTLNEQTHQGFDDAETQISPSTEEQKSLYKDKLAEIDSNIRCWDEEWEGDLPLALQNIYETKRREFLDVRSDICLEYGQLIAKEELSKPMSSLYHACKLIDNIRQGQEVQDNSNQFACQIAKLWLDFEQAALNRSNRTTNDILQTYHQAVIHRGQPAQEILCRLRQQALSGNKAKTALRHIGREHDEFARRLLNHDYDRNIHLAAFEHYKHLLCKSEKEFWVHLIQAARKETITHMHEFQLRRRSFEKTLATILTTKPATECLKSNKLR